ncbi:MAG: hypothetical protein HQK51_04630 [Oligoflexia bacterium]|nr:hypothetical protein [Oligoflexia bacterium]
MSQTKILNIALIGNGKTGSKVEELINEEKNYAHKKLNLIGPFNTRNKIENNLDELSKADVVIVFTPASAIDFLCPYLLDANKMVLWGCTGYNWEEKKHILEIELNKKNLLWIYASNFSLMMNLIKELITTSKKFLPLYQQPFSNNNGNGDENKNESENKRDDRLKISIKEIHHIHKKDVPSGTALLWKEWFQKQKNNISSNISIESIREDDVVGIHELTIESKYEKIKIVHESKDRRLFAEGALWGARKLSEIVNETNSSGLLNFNDFVLKYLYLSTNPSLNSTLT